MSIRIVIIAMVVLQLAGCVAYSKVSSSGVPINIGGLLVTTSQSWNQAPKNFTPIARPESVTWTQDGLLLDRIILIPAVPNGEPIFKTASKQATLPVFRSDMLPNEIQDLMESSLTKLFSEGEVSVETVNLRPHKFGKRRGILFDLDIRLTDGPDYGGVVGSFVAGEQLYALIYLGAKPYYYEKHLEEGMAVIQNARL